jgi:hypothetical protein
MLKLQTFLPCEKVIIDKEELASLINVLDSINVELNDKTALREDAASLLDWIIFTVWRKTDITDGGKRYEQRVELLSPDGQQIFEVLQPFNVNKTHFNFRVLTKIGAIPIGKKGNLTLKIYLREAGDSNEWQRKGEYPIGVIHIMKEEVKSVKKRIEKRRK